MAVGAHPRRRYISISVSGWERIGKEELERALRTAHPGVYLKVISYGRTTILRTDAKNSARMRVALPDVVCIGEKEIRLRPLLTSGALAALRRKLR